MHRPVHVRHVHGFYDASALACSHDCTVDVSGCSGYCGDGVVNGPEQCGDAAVSDAASCSTDCLGQYLFGKNSVGASTGTLLSHWKLLSRFTVDHETTVGELVYHVTPGPTLKMIGVIYADDGHDDDGSAGEPGTLMAVTRPTAFPESNEAAGQSLPLAVPLTLPAGSYWLGVMYYESLGRYAYDDAAAGLRVGIDLVKDGADAPFVGARTEDRELSIYGASRFRVMA